MTERDAVVIGGGPAGLAAATWLARYRRTVTVLDSSEYRNRWTEHVHGYLGHDPVPPDDLLRRARSALERSPHVELVAARAESVGRQESAFVVGTADGRLEARRIVLATGVVDEFPDIPGFFEHYGADVLHCPACDGYEARDRDVVAIGWDEHVVGFALGLLEWARRVTVVTEGKRFDADDTHRERLANSGIGIVEEPVRGFVGTRGALEGLSLESGDVVECDFAFFSIAHHPRTELAEQLGCALTEEGYIRTDRSGATTVPGVYAAGDVTPGEQLVQVAAAQGTIAGIACARSLSDV
jgi:thioredoxin reductase